MNNPLRYIDPLGLISKVPGGVDLGGGSSVRIDNKNLQPNQKPHAHFQSPKGKGVVDIDGDPSHGKKSNLQNLNKTIKKYLQKHGFKLRALSPSSLILPILQQYCTANPGDTGCLHVPPGNGWTGIPSGLMARLGLSNSSCP